MMKIQPLKENGHAKPAGFADAPRFTEGESPFP